MSASIIILPNAQTVRQYDVEKFSKLIRIPLNDILLFNSLFESEIEITERDSEKFNGDIEKIIKERGLKVHGK